MKAKVFLVTQKRNGPYRDGSLDSTRLLSVVVAADASMAEEAAWSIGCVLGSEEHHGMTFELGYMEVGQIGEIETTEKLPLVLEVRS